MAVPIEHLAGGLTVIEGGRAKQYAEEARIEYAVLLDEVERLAGGILTDVGCLQVVSAGAMQKAGKIGYLVTEARRELQALTGTGPETAA